MCDDDAVQNVNSIFDEPDGEIAIENMNDVYSKFCHEVHRYMALTLPVKHIVINGTERKEYYRKMKPWWTNELSELWKIRCAAEKLYCKSDNDSKRELLQQFLSHQRNLMMRFDVQKDAIGLRNKKKSCQSTSPMLSGRKWVQWG